MTHQLTGKRVLIIEDDNILAITLADELAAEGAKVIGPAATVADALDVIAASTDLDGAIRARRSMIRVRMLPSFEIPAGHLLEPPLAHPDEAFHPGLRLP